jgi:hypothetical protein
MNFKIRQNLELSTKTATFQSEVLNSLANIDK